MTEIPNDKYITVKRDEKGEIVVLFGNQPATKYNDQEIYDIEYVKETFAWMQEQDPEIEEFHIGAFATGGECAKVGNPDRKFGPYAWCRVKKKCSSAAPWVFSYTFGSAADCAYCCANFCAYRVRNYAFFWSAVLGAKIDNAKNDNAQSVSKTPKTPKTPKKPLVINLPWHIITIEKRKRTM